jgi:hypothetical protein
MPYDGEINQEITARMIVRAARKCHIKFEDGYGNGDVEGF